MLDLYSMGGKLVIGVVEYYSKGRIDSHSKYDANRQGQSLWTVSFQISQNHILRVDISKKKRSPVISKHRFQVPFGHFALAGADPTMFSTFILLFSWSCVGAWQERI